MAKKTPIDAEQQYHDVSNPISLEDLNSPQFSLNDELIFAHDS